MEVCLTIVPYGPIPAKGVEVFIYDEASTSADARRLMGLGGTERDDGFTTAKDKKV